MNPVTEKPSWWEPGKAGRCLRCGAWWSGLAVCHCAACHHTFTGISAFDSHRRGGVCLDPDGTLVTKDDTTITGSVMWGWPTRSGSEHWRRDEP